MYRWKVVVPVVIAVLVGTVCIGGVFSQQARPAGPAGGQQRARWDPEQIRQRNLARIRGALRATDEEWDVLQPKIEKVQALSAAVRGGGRMWARRGAAPRAADAPPPTELEKATEELQATLTEEDAKPQDIRRNLAALRKAREKAKQELAKAQKALSEKLALRHEAQLVLLGLLD